MGICSSCKKESPEGKRYCSDCEERLRAKLSALESDLAKEEEDKRQKEETLRLEEERRRAAERLREEEASASRARDGEDKKTSGKGSGKAREEDDGSGARRPAGRRNSKKEAARESGPGEKDPGAAGEKPAEPAGDEEAITSDIVTARLLAGAIDFSAAVAGGLLLGRVMNFLGWIWVVAFLLLKDALFDGASPGKKVLGLVVRRARAGDLADTNNSVIRNLTIAAGPLLMGLGNLLMIDIPIIPDPFAPIGAGLMLLGTVVTVTALSLEFYWMRGDSSHRRFGDKIARTTVEWAEETTEDPRDDAEEAEGGKGGEA